MRLPKNKAARGALCALAAALGFLLLPVVAIAVALLYFIVPAMTL